MQIDRQVLDKVFFPFFKQKADGDEVSLVELNWLYDYKQRCGPLTKEEAEYVINTQIAKGSLIVVAPSSFKICTQASSGEPYVVSQEVIAKAAKTYSAEFWKKYRELKNT